MIGRRAAEVADALKTLAGLDEPVEQIQAEIRERFNAEVDTAVHPTPGLFALLDHIGSASCRRRSRRPRGVPTQSGC